MKNRIVMWVLVALVMVPGRAYADMFGGDDAILAQILANAIEQLENLHKMLKSGEDMLGLIQDINRGINDSLSVIDSISHSIDPGIYGDLKKVEAIARHLHKIYGVIANSPESQVQSDTDRTIAEAIAMNNSLYDYASELDKVGEQIKSFSHTVSPGGATKLTAQSLGVMVHVMNQQLRAQATGLKLSAQSMAVQNRKEKAQTAEYLNEMATLQNAMSKKDINFNFPRF